MGQKVLTESGSWVRRSSRREAHGSESKGGPKERSAQGSQAGPTSNREPLSIYLFLFIHSFILGCDGSSLPRAGSLWLQQAGTPLL